MNELDTQSANLIKRQAAELAALREENHALDIEVRHFVGELKRLRGACAEAYQIMGAAMLGDPVAYTQDDVARALDNLVAAANGDPLPHDDLLPWPKRVGQ